MVKVREHVDARLTLWPEWYCHKCGRAFDAEVQEGPDGPDAGPPPYPDEKCLMRTTKAGEVPSCRLSLVDTWNLVG